MLKKGEGKEPKVKSSLKPGKEFNSSEYERAQVTITVSLQLIYKTIRFYILKKYRKIVAKRFLQSFFICTVCFYK